MEIGENWRKDLKLNWLDPIKLMILAHILTMNKYMINFVKR